jgi:hypothetical protein
MSHFFQQIEAVLLPSAIPYAPEGTAPKAVVHQWAHAVANNSDLGPTALLNLSFICFCLLF